VAYQQLSDEDLIALVASGKQAALEELYERHHRRTFSLAYGIVGDRGTAEEVVQDAFSQVWRRAGTYRPELGKASSWVLSIAHHRAIDMLRKRRHEAGADVGYEEALGQEAFRRPQESMDDYAISLEVGAKVRKLLAQLPPAQQEVLVLAYFYGYTQSEIARKTKQPLGTVKTRMRTALIKLREVIGPVEE
jgi:RNA polymerase sigma-70 factor (ECF subfamily)